MFFKKARYFYAGILITSIFGVLSMGESTMAATCRIFCQATVTPTGNGTPFTRVLPAGGPTCTADNECGCTNTVCNSLGAASPGNPYACATASVVSSYCSGSQDQGAKAWCDEAPVRSHSYNSFCDLPPAAPPPSGTPTPAPAAPTTSGPGTCVFACARNGVKTQYSGARIACTNAADCVNRCPDACAGIAGGPSSPAVCVLQSFTPTPAASELPRCDGVRGTSRTLDNPLKTTDIGELLARLIRAITGIAGSMALLMFVAGGVIWMTAESSDRVQLAQTILKNASLGLVLIFLAYSLVSLFLSVLGV